MTAKEFFNQIDLSRRWSISARTLEQWRWRGEGPKFIKIGGSVRYHAEDVEAYEQPYSQAHYDAFTAKYGDTGALDKYSTIFINSTTVAERLTFSIEQDVPASSTPNSQQNTKHKEAKNELE